MEIQLHGQYKEQDLRNSLALMLPLGRGLKITGIVVGIIAAISLMSIIVAVIAGMMGKVGGDVLQDFLSIPLFILFISAIVLMVLWQFPRNLLRQYQDSPLLQGTFSGAVTGEALELRSEHSESKTRWSAYVQYKMSDQVVLLYQSKAAASIVPRGLFASDEDWQQFRQFVRATVPQKAQQGSRTWRWGALILFVLLLLIFAGSFLWAYFRGH